jgi:hypothetical protein
LLDRIENHNCQQQFQYDYFDIFTGYLANVLDWPQ